jgi:uncharacterized membrane protein
LHVVDVRRATMRNTSVNVGDLERWMSAIAGGALALWAVARRTGPATAAGLVGGALLYRGVSGHCPLYGALGIDTAGHGEDDADRVDTTSEDSFPASDAPSWTPNTSFTTAESG